MRYKRLFLSAAVLLCALLSAFSQTIIQEPDLRTPSFITPFYFGPNAFPVPDLLDGTVADDLSVGVYADSFWGFRGDHTNDIAAKVVVPLFSDRVNFSLWVPLQEFYRNSDENIRVCRLEDIDDKRLRKGNLFGDVFVSLDVQALREKKYIPDVALRCIFKTASSNNTFCIGRFYDSPGYSFDASAGKSFVFSNTGIFRDLRASGTIGFLCWQTDNGRQDDALLYGLQLGISGPKLSLQCSWSGYNGWESGMKNNAGAHDCPSTLKVNATYKLNRFDLTIGYQEGLRDYPYRQLRLGTSYHIDILGKYRRKK